MDRLARSTVAFGREALRALRDRPERSMSSYDAVFATPNPWRYDQAPYERERFATAVALLAEGGRARSALEIGCAEGAFTALLAEHADRVVAVDFSQPALDRAAERVPANVELRRLDLRSGPAPGVHDLVVAMDVLDTIYRPAAARAARATIVSAMPSGGRLLFSAKRQGDLVEDAAWSRRLLVRGSKHLLGSLTRDPRLELVRAVPTAEHLVAILRRT